MTTLTTAQRECYDKVLRARDEVSYCYHRMRSSRGVDDSNKAARELTNARAHFTAALTQLIESVQNDEHRNPSIPPQPQP